jgi:hypothetical protein
MAFDVLNNVQLHLTETTKYEEIPVKGPNAFGYFLY